MRLSKRKTAFALAVMTGLLVAIPTFAADWKEDGRGWQYQYADGKVHTGWLQLNGKWYYFDNSGHMLANTFQDINGKKFMFDNSGVMATGWCYGPDGNWYYFSMNGEMQTGWHLISGWWYYLDTATGRMLKGWNKINGEWYYMYDSGNMAHDAWVDNKYYLLSDGRMAVGQHRISGQTYLFNSDGKWIPDADQGQTGNVTSLTEELLYNKALPDLDWNEVGELGKEYYANFHLTSTDAIEKLNAVRKPEHLVDLKFSSKLTQSAFALCIASKAWGFWGVDDSSTDVREYEAALYQYEARDLGLNVTMVKGATLNEALNEVLLTQKGVSMLKDSEAQTCGVGFIKVDNEYRVVVFTGKMPQN